MCPARSENDIVDGLRLCLDGPKHERETKKIERRIITVRSRWQEAITQWLKFEAQFSLDHKKWGSNCGLILIPIQKWETLLLIILSSSILRGVISISLVLWGGGVTSSLTQMLNDLPQETAGKVTQQGVRGNNVLCNLRYVPIGHISKRDASKNKYGIRWG